MSENIKKFIDNLNDWEKNLTVKKFKNESVDEFSNLANMQINSNLPGLLDIWERKLKQKYFELPHPELPEINTRAVYNLRDGMSNLIFMIDQENKYPWILGQCFNMLDYIVTMRYIVRIGVFEFPILKSLQVFSTLNVEQLQFKSIEFGFTLGQARPFHYFYDHLKNFYSINSGEHTKKVEFRNSFYRPKNFTQASSELVFFFPATVRIDILDEPKSSKVISLNNQMENKIFQEVAGKVLSHNKQDKKIKLWYGITGQKRSWVQQVDAIKNIVENLLNYFNEVEIFIDGITAPEGKVNNNLEDNEVFEKILNLIKSICTVNSLIGLDYIKKIQACSEIDYFIANAGTGCLVPLRFCKKPGVLHSNNSTFSFPQKETETIKYTKKEHTIQVFDPKTKNVDFASYHISWQHVYNLLTDVINYNENTDIKKITVPTIDEIAKRDNYLIESFYS